MNELLAFTPCVHDTKNQSEMSDKERIELTNHISWSNVIGQFDF